jgi:copper chaperone CopZ
MKHFNITGMTCEGCVVSVMAALHKVDATIMVTLHPPQAQVPAGVNLSELQAALKDKPKYRIDAENALESEETRGWFQTYLPLIVIMGLISLVSLKEAYDFHGWMMSFMAGFFIVFGAFKLFDLKGFADAYATYDIIAARSRLYALAYPFIEIALGFAFLFHYQMRAAVWVSIILMAVGTVGVVKTLMKKQQIKCACLGTSLNLPMSTVTLVEDVGMLAMGLMML